MSSANPDSKPDLRSRAQWPDGLFCCYLWPTSGYSNRDTGRRGIVNATDAHQESGNSHQQ